MHSEKQDLMGDKRVEGINTIVYGADEVQQPLISNVPTGNGPVLGYTNARNINSSYQRSSEFNLGAFRLREEDLPLPNRKAGGQVRIDGMVSEWTCTIDDNHGHIRAAKKCSRCNLLMCLQCEVTFRIWDIEKKEICVTCKDELDAFVAEQIRLEEERRQREEEARRRREEEARAYRESQRIPNAIKSHSSTQCRICFSFVSSAVLIFSIFLFLVVWSGGAVAVLIPIVLLLIGAIELVITLVFILTMICFCVACTKYPDEHKPQARRALFLDVVMLWIQMFVHVVAIVLVVVTLVIVSVAVVGIITIMTVIMIDMN